MPRAATTTDVFTAVAESSRRSILAYLASQERPVGDVCAGLGMPQPSISVLERVPGAHLAWRPHEKSMSMGQLALHVASNPGNAAAMVRQSPFGGRASPSLPRRATPNCFARTTRASPGRGKSWAA